MPLKLFLVNTFNLIEIIFFSIEGWSNGCQWCVGFVASEQYWNVNKSISGNCVFVLHGVDFAKMLIGFCRSWSRAEIVNNTWSSEPARAYAERTQAKRTVASIPEF